MPLLASKGELHHHWIDLSAELRSITATSEEALQIISDYTSEQIWAGLGGAACEHIERQNGSVSPAFPLVPLAHDDLYAWLSYHEVWDARPKAKFSFRKVKIGISIGRVGEKFKCQVFRSEWPGFAVWAGSTPTFNTPGAGHPHWQFDALESVVSAQMSAAQIVFSDNDENEIGDFTPPPSNDVFELVKKVTLSKIHFASSAPWWLKSPEQPLPHVNKPKDIAGLRRWVVGCIAYLNTELQRLT